MTGSFLITGHGRSGTKFLAGWLNQSPTWTVHHEPRPRRLVSNPSAVARRFERDNYGEVNSLLRLVALRLPIRRAVILRHPAQIVVSFYNKRKYDRRDYRQAVSALVAGFKALDDCVEAGLPVIWFDRMVSDEAYLGAIARWCGIHDVQPTPKAMRRVNNVPADRIVARSLADCAKPLQARYAADVAWFAEKYFDGAARVNHLV